MRLKNYGAGEVSDRLSILALKRLFGTEAGKDVKHFEAEGAVLLSEIRTRTLNGKWFTAYTDLAAVNAALWHAEDDLRSWREKYKDQTPIDKGTAIYNWMEVGKLAFRIQFLNDRRAELIGLINHDAGDVLGDEKING